MDDFLKGFLGSSLPHPEVQHGSPENDTLAIGDSEIGDSITFRFQPLKLGSVYFWHTFVC